MTTTIIIGETSLELRSSALTSYLYKNIFGQDLQKKINALSKSYVGVDLDSINIDVNEDSEETVDNKLKLLSSIPEEVLDVSTDFADVYTKLAFVMNVQATRNFNEYNKIKVDDFYQWLDNIEDPNCFNDGDIQSQIADAYASKNESQLKKKSGN